MDKHLLTEIEIKDFKCFKGFKAEGLKRVNLIGGKNNVGKTAFMEACFVNMQAQSLKQFVFSLVACKGMRENLNRLAGDKINLKAYLEQTNNIYTKSNLNLASFKIEENKGIKEYIFEFNQQSIKVNVNDFSYELGSYKNIMFINNFGLANRRIRKQYSVIQKKDAESFLNTILHDFDARIESFKIIDEKPQCKIDEKYLEITEFGDGVRHLVSIVTALYACENSYLFIDEIDNGIHYTQNDTLWSIILNVSQKLNVQVFAVTHSKECIESYARVTKRVDDKEICYIKMSRLKDDSIKAGVRDFGMLQDSIDDNHEVRGW